MTASITALMASAVFASAAAAGVTSASTFTATGTDPTTASTASSLGTSGTTAEGDTINWVLSYLNTTGSSANTTITDPIAGNQTFVPGSLHVPPNLTPAWSTNTGLSFSTTEPGSGVNAIQAQGTTIAGTTGEQALATTPTGGFAAGNSNGDGWEPIFVGGNVYNVHHHTNVGGGLTMLDCHVKATAAECPGYPTNVAETAGTPFGAATTLDTPVAPYTGVDAANGRIWIPVSKDGTTSFGLVCADVINNTSCGYVQLGTSPTVVTTGGATYEFGGTQIGTKLYVASDQPGGPVYCFDMATQAMCAGYPVNGDPTYADNTQPNGGFSSVRAFDGRYVFINYRHTNGNHDIGCIDTTTNAICAGVPGWPRLGFVNDVPGINDMGLAPITDAAGNITGICGAAATTQTAAPWVCFNLDGSAIPAGAPWGQLVPGDLVGLNNVGEGTLIGTRLYLPYNNQTTSHSTYTCWDFATAAKCAGFVEASSGAVVQAYTIRQDPQNPDCLWELGNAGVFEVFSATFGGTTCNEGSAKVALTPADFYCDGGSGHVTGWKQLVLGGITASDYDGLAVSITDANGNPVPGWTNRSFDSSQQSIDISSIPYSGSTTTLHVSVAINWGGHTVRTATLAATFTGDPAQVCFKTTVGPSSCNVDQSITNSANAVTIGTNGVSDAPAGNSTGAATFLEAATPKTSRCKADLSIDKSAGVDFISPGGQVTYTLVVENHGPDTATSAKVSDDVPAGLTITSLQPNQGTCSTSAGEIKCQLGTIANGGMVQILVMADASSSIQVGSTVKNCASTTAFQTDPVASNNSSCVSKPVKPEPPGAVDIQVSKHVDTRVAKFGKPVTYTLDVRNNGPDRAPDARVTDTSGLPLRILSAKSSQGTCGSRQPLACDLGPLASGETATITVKAIPKQTGPTVNTVSTTPGCNDSGCATDTDPRNNVSSARVTVKPYITLVKSVSTHVVKAGHELTYRLTVANPTPVNVPNVRVCDTLPAGIVFVRSTPSGTLSNGRHCWPLGTLGGNRSRGITIVGRAASGASGRIVNHATATGTGVDPAHAKAGVRVIAKPPVPTPVTG